MNEPRSKDKPFAIPKQAVVEAFRKVKANQGGPGVDGCTIEDFEADLRNTLYVTWNRMSSGSYFPPPVVTRHAEWARMGRETSGSAGMTGGACGVVVAGDRVGTTEWERPARLKFAA